MKRALVFFLFCLPIILFPQDKGVVREVAISFDDLPTVDITKTNIIKTEITEKLLSVIKKHNIPAIGMVNEAKLYIEGKLDTFSVNILKQWVEAGLDLGNHTYSHIDFNKTTLEQQKEEVLKGEIIIKELLKKKDKTPSFFRYPFLHTGTDSASRQSFELFLKDHGYDMAPVSIDNSDWVFAKAYSTTLNNNDTLLAKRIAEDYTPYMEEKFVFYERCSEELFGREIKQVLLVHANRLNADCFNNIAKMLLKRGYKFISIAEAVKDPAYKTNPVFSGRAGLSWPHLWPLVLNLKGDSAKRTPFTPEYIMQAASVIKEF